MMPPRPERFVVKASDLILSDLAKQRLARLLAVLKQKAAGRKPPA